LIAPRRLGDGDAAGGVAGRVGVVDAAVAAQGEQDRPPVERCPGLGVGQRGGQRGRVVEVLAGVAVVHGRRRATVDLLVERRCGGTVESAVTTRWVGSVDVAAKPMPRPANTSQIRHWLAPALSVVSAASMPSRALRNVGFVTVFFIPSTINSSWVCLPLSWPSFWISLVRRSHS